MTDINQFHDSFVPPPPPQKKIPDMLNVLTILTFIGCAFGLIGAVYNYFMVCNSVKLLNDMPEDNPMAGMMSGEALASIQRQCDMRTPLLIINLICLALCFIGALQMRKLKKSGFYIYSIGEIVGPVAMAILAGISMSGLGMIGTVVGFLIVVVFVILYASQLKHMR